ncbi:MAG: glycosyltransferase [Candidatus Helarchaeota archaeon]
MVASNKQVKVSVLIPTFNEEKIIEKKILSILDSNYKHLDIHVIDESDDSTPSIVRKFQSKFSNIYLHHFSDRMGYNLALMTGIEQTTSEIIVLTDSHSLLDNNAISKCLEVFNNNPKIGGIYGKGELLSSKSTSSKLEQIYMNFFYFTKKLESIIYSSPLVKGEFFAIRRELYTGFNNPTGSFDNDIANWIIKNGFKIILNDKIIFREQFPNLVSERIAQKKIRATNVQKVLWKYKSFLFNPKYGLYGILIYPFNFYQFFIMPFHIFVSSISLLVFIVLSFIGRSSNQIFFIFSIVLVIIMLIIIVVPKTRHATISALQMEYCLFHGIFYNIFKSKNDTSMIPKIDSVRHLKNES